MYPVIERFSDVANTATSLGQLTGIIGTLLFSFSLILSFRNKFIEVIFGGLDKLYKVHHSAGMYGFFFLLLHPLLLVVPRLFSSAESATAFFIPFQTSTAIDYGIFSILAFMLFIGITLFGVIFSYGALKKAHSFLGAAFLLGAIHGFMIPSDIQDDMFIRVWVLGFVFLGIASYITYSLLKRYTVKKYFYVVANVKKIEGGITELTLSPRGESFTHLPGQFAFFSFTNSKIVSDESHPFTISSYKENGEINVSAKSLGDFTSLLSSENIGDEVSVEGPFGEFSYGYAKRAQVWVAGGIGVTPFVSFVEHALTSDHFPYDIDFFYSVQTEKDLAYHELFLRAAKAFSSFRYHPMPTDRDGYVTGDSLAQKVNGVMLRDIFICGPPMMINAVSSSLISLGIKRSSIHSELFSLLK
jgi:predicted ferric reductase